MGDRDEGEFGYVEKYNISHYQWSMVRSRSDAGGLSRNTEVEHDQPHEGQGEGGGHELHAGRVGGWDDQQRLRIVQPLH